MTAKNTMKKILEHPAHTLAGYEKNLIFQLQKEAMADSVNYIKNIRYDFMVFDSKTQVFEILKNRLKAGCILEFGVDEGVSLNRLAGIFPEKTVHGFDSFEGLPRDWMTVKTKFSNVVPSVKMNVRLYKGWFEKTIPEFKKSNFESISFFNIDCDIYESAKTVFDLLGDQMTDYVYLDDYFVRLNWQNNIFKAFNEFIRSSGKNYKYIAIVANGGVLVKINE